MNTRALEELFAKSSSRSAEIVDQISVSVLEIYCEQIRDLLAADVTGGPKLEVRVGPLLRLLGPLLRLLKL